MPDQNTDAIAILNKKLQDCDLPTRVKNCVALINLVTVRDLIGITEVEMRKTPNFGKKSLMDLREWMRKNNLAFRSYR